MRLVLTPETVVVAEARRSLTTLSLFGYRVDGVVANRVFPERRRGPLARRGSRRSRGCWPRSSSPSPACRCGGRRYRPGSRSAWRRWPTSPRRAYGGDDPLAPPDGGRADVRDPDRRGRRCGSRCRSQPVRRRARPARRRAGGHRRLLPAAAGPAGRARGTPSRVPAWRTGRCRSGSAPSGGRAGVSDGGRADDRSAASARRPPSCSRPCRTGPGRTAATTPRRPPRRRRVPRPGLTTSTTTSPPAARTAATARSAR